MRPFIIDSHLRDLREEGYFKDKVRLHVLPNPCDPDLPTIMAETFFGNKGKLLLTGLDIILERNDEFTLYRTKNNAVAIKIVQNRIPKGHPAREIRTSCYRIRDIKPMK
jgi:hypothetical protein